MDERTPLLLNDPGTVRQPNTTSLLALRKKYEKNKMNNDMLKPTSLIQRQNNSNAKINEDGKDQNSSLTVSSADISCETGDDLVSTEAGRSRLPTFVDSDLSVGISFPSRSIPSDDVETRSAASDGFTFSTHCSKEVSTSESGHIGSGTARRRRRQRRRRTCSEGDRLQQNQRQLFASLLLPNVLTPAPVRVQRRLSYVQPLGTSHMLDSGYGTISHRKEHIPARDVVKEEKISESEESEEQEEEFSSEESDVSSKSHPLTAKDWITICMLAMANLCSTTAFSCLAPFYPAEARIKGMDDTQTGIVFGIFELVMFLSAPVLGRNIIRIGSKCMFVCGLGLTAVTAVLFGFLAWLPPGPQFFWVSLVIRIMEAVGDAAFTTSSFAISAKCFPRRIATVVGIMETFAGLGYTVGPPIGGILYEYGGFMTPFWVLGSVLLLTATLSYWIIENFEEESFDESKGMLDMLRIPTVWLLLFAVVICSISLSFLDPTLAPHLESFNLSPSIVGLIFLLDGGIYTITAPLWGMIIDRFHCKKSLMFFGLIGTTIAMLVIGPSPLFGLNKNLVFINIAIVVLGMSSGALYIPIFQNCLDVVLSHDYEENFQTYGCVSGLLESAFSFGGFLGPTVGGFGVQFIGFPWTTTYIALIVIIFTFVSLLCYGGEVLYRWFNHNRSVS